MKIEPFHSTNLCDQRGVSLNTMGYAAYMEDITKIHMCRSAQIMTKE